MDKKTKILNELNGFERELNDVKANLKLSKKILLKVMKVQKSLKKYKKISFSSLYWCIFIPEILLLTILSILLEINSFFYTTLIFVMFVFWVLIIFLVKKHNYLISKIEVL